MYLIIIALLCVFVVFGIFQGSEKYHTYNTICITSTPTGHIHQVPAITYWKNLIKNQKAKIKTDKYMSSRAEGVMSPETKVLSKTLANGEIDVEYYKNPVLYCQLNPDKRPCPNNWLVQSDKN